jgi:hypothetical protein
MQVCIERDMVPACTNGRLAPQPQPRVAADGTRVKASEFFTLPAQLGVPMQVKWLIDAAIRGLA